jgi:hypothetical protein
MEQVQLCHWLLFEPTGKCRSVFAPAGDKFQNYQRVGPVASSPQFVFAIVFAVSEHLGKIPLPPFPKGEQNLVRLRILFHRDDRSQPGPAFSQTAPLKIATLISELTLSIAQWIEAVGGRFEALRLLDDSDGALELVFDTQSDDNLKITRCTELVKAGIEMMAYARGLKGVLS